MSKAKSSIQLNKWVFFPPIVFLAITIFYSIYFKERFLIRVQFANDWIIDHFGWLFNWAGLLFLVILAVVYWTPLGKVRIGGANAKPILSKWRWFAIATCTTIATGILFWGCAEPLYHLHQPPAGLGFESSSVEARNFAMSTMFMHWSITPYGIYCICGLLFAIVYYNLKEPFSVSSLFYPIFRKRAESPAYKLLDIICLYALVMGMAASLASGILAIMGGLENTLSVTKTNTLLGLIGMAVVLTFIISAASGLQRGIKVLSNFNMIMFIILAFTVLLLGDTLGMMSIGLAGLKEYVVEFLPRSTDISSGLNRDWIGDWTIFYWANWFAWAPVASLFLGRLAVGYTVRDYMHCNLTLPALFTILWMTIFSGSTLSLDMADGGRLYELMTSAGEESVMYAVLNELPGGSVFALITLIMVFISYVTAADSNISAMSAISTTGIDPKHPEAPIAIKVIWGLVIGTLSWIMLTYAGIDGIRLLSVLGGFPAMFIVIIAAIGLIILMVKPGLISGEQSA